MIISKTPYRVSFFGGGTDYPKWFNKNGGKVISSAINKYSYIIIKNLEDLENYKYRIRYYKREEAKTIDKISHPVIKQALKLFQINNKIEIIHFGDLLAKTGIGSSSSFTVGLLQALNRLNNKKISKKTLAIQAINLEQNILKEYVGSQDQVAASYGGFNKIVFSKKNKFSCRSIKINKKNLINLEDHCQLYFTNIQRNADDYAKHKIKNISKNSHLLKKISEITNEAEKIFKSNYKKEFVLEIGKLLNEQWIIKKSLANSITNSKIDSIYNKAINNGAIGGKLLGAGGGGFFMFLVPPEKQKYLSNKLNLKKINIKFDFKGSRLISEKFVF